MKIVIIDSGIDLSNEYFSSFSITGFGVCENKNETINITPDYQDEIGHGTAVSSVLTRLIPSADFIICKIFHNEAETSENILIEALNHIYNNIDCDLINISAGIVQCNDMVSLKKICNKITEKGIIIVSAFDNSGAVSYPAALNNVIGVTANELCKHDYDFIYINNSIINISAKGICQNLLWKKHDNMLVSGSSFAAPYVTAYIANLINNTKYTFNSVLNELRKKSFKELNYNTYNVYNKNIEINRAIIFPFNKEMHSLFRFSDLLPFEICGTYNIKYFGNIGKKVEEILSIDSKEEHIIENVLKINWENNFDTVILGHCKDICEIINYNVKEEIIKNCIKYKKNLFSFDSDYVDDKVRQLFHDNNLNIYCPEISEESVPKSLMGRLYISSVPIISVLGTSSKQGKFSLQLILRRFFIQKGYLVGQLGTEPTSKLFEFDEVFPIGYNSVVQISGSKSISVLNNMIHNIEEKQPDIIITGSQSNIVPRQIRNLKDIPYNGYEYLLGIDPDCALVCVDYEDDVDFIKRTVDYVQGLTQTVVLSIVLFPLKKNLTWSGVHTEEDIIDIDNLKTKKNELMSTLNLPVYINGDKEDMSTLCEQCISYLSE